LKYSTAPAKIDIIIKPEEARRVSITVKDEGIGIAKEDRDLIFQKFYRTGNENTRRTKGTGLGLFIVNEIVKAHKGTITLKPNTPTGRIFTVTLPLNN